MTEGVMHAVGGLLRKATKTRTPRDKMRIRRTVTHVDKLLS